jgi:hypothetical protein
MPDKCIINDAVCGIQTDPDSAIQFLPVSPFE